jgi:glyoxylase-like metal-dependent hydrolase (beta-lactamase superfamily II)
MQKSDLTPTGEIVLIKGENHARFPDSNCLFVDDEVPAVIDPATKREHLEGLDRDRGVRLVINTHYHVDHTRYDGLFPNADIAANAIDAPAIESVEGMAKAVGVEDVPWRQAWEHVMRERWGFTEKRVSRPVSDADEISLGKNTLRFIHTPGHTAGHTCVYFVEKKAIFLGDIDLGSFGPWYANKGSDINAFLQSIERLKSIDAETWYKSHGDGALHGDIADRLDAFARVIYERDERVLDFLSRERMFEEIVREKIIYRKAWDPPQLFDFFEGMMVGKHLARLERQGLVACDGDRYRAVS